MAWTTPRTWVAGEAVTSSLLNTHIRDNMAFLSVGQPDTQDITPDWTSTGTAPAIGDGLLTATWWQTGKWVFSIFAFQAGASTTYGTGTYSFSLPTTAQAASRCGGGAILYDSSTTSYYTGHVDIATTSTFQVSTGGTTQTFIGQTSPFTWANGDYCKVSLMYEAV